MNFFKITCVFLFYFESIQGTNVDFFWRAETNQVRGLTSEENTLLDILDSHFTSIYENLLSFKTKVSEENTNMAFCFNEVTSLIDNDNEVLDIKMLSHIIISLFKISDNQLVNDKQSKLKTFLQNITESNKYFYNDEFKDTENLFLGAFDIKSALKLVEDLLFSLKIYDVYECVKVSQAIRNMTENAENITKYVSEIIAIVKKFYITLQYTNDISKEDDLRGILGINFKDILAIYEKINDEHNKYCITLDKNIFSYVSLTYKEYKKLNDYQRLYVFSHFEFTKIITLATKQLEVTLKELYDELNKLLISNVEQLPENKKTIIKMLNNNSITKLKDYHEEIKYRVFFETEIRDSTLFNKLYGEKLQIFHSILSISKEITKTFATYANKISYFSIDDHFNDELETYINELLTNIKKELSEAIKNDNKKIIKMNMKFLDNTAEEECIGIIRLIQRGDFVSSKIESEKLVFYPKISLLTFCLSMKSRLLYEQYIFLLSIIHKKSGKYDKVNAEKVNFDNLDPEFPKITSEYKELYFFTLDINYRAVLIFNLLQ